MKNLKEYHSRRKLPHLAIKDSESWKASRKTFCQGTSLHGWKHLDLEQNFFLRMVWILVLASTCVMSLFFMFYYTNQFLSATIVTSIDSTIAPIEV